MESTFEIIKSNYVRDKKQNTPYIIGINGIDCAGKTTLARDLSGRLKQSEINNEIFHIDDFNDPKVEKDIWVRAHNKYVSEVNPRQISDVIIQGP